MTRPDMPADHVQVNGHMQTVPADGRRLVDWLREDLDLKGTKDACGRGDCGACSVLVDGAVVLACCTIAATLGGRCVTTIEGLASSDTSEPIFAAFAQHGALQCGFCTPGMVVAAYAFLARAALADREAFDEAAVRHALAGNVCRCTGYGQIVDAVLAAYAGRSAR